LLQALLVKLPPASWAAAQVPAILGIMQDSVDRFRRTIEHLTAVIKVQKSEPQALAPADVLAFIADVRLDLAPELRAAGGRLEVDVTDCQPLPFAEKNLHSVVYNLLSNAIKYRDLVRCMCTSTAIPWAARWCWPCAITAWTWPTSPAYLPCSSACTTTWRAPALVCTR